MKTFFVMLRSVLCTAIGFNIVSAQAASFTGLSGSTLGPTFVNAISADGTTAVGSASNGPFYWTEDTGLVNLVHHNQGQSSINATDVSADGKIIVGNLSSCSSGGCGSSSFLWTEQAGLQYPSYAGTRVSADGLVFVTNVEVGIDGHRGAWAPFRSTAQSRTSLFGDTSKTRARGAAGGISGDGSVIVGGFGDVPLPGSEGSSYQAYRWTAETGMVGLGDLPGGDFQSGAANVSDDGTVVVGQSASDKGGEAFRWTHESGMIGLGILPGGTFSSATAVSADGSVVVGVSGTGEVTQAFIWQDKEGGQSLKTYLADKFSLDLDGWTLSNAVDISADGTRIVGNGINPAGHNEAWIAVVPEPGSSSLMVCGLLLGLLSRVVGTGRHPGLSQGSQSSRKPPIFSTAL